MSLPVVISLRAEHDLTLQYRWYLENADEETAERYLKAVWLHRGFNSGASCDAMPSFPAMAKVTHPPEPEFAFLDPEWENGNLNRRAQRTQSKAFPWKKVPRMASPRR